MIQGLIIVKAAHVEEARALAQQPPFSTAPEEAAAFLVPANAVYAEDGATIAIPATLHWASGVFEDAFWASIAQAAGVLDWGGAWEYDLDADPTFPQRQLASMNANESFSVR